MKNTPFLLRGHARKDLESIRRYTIKKWGNPQWLKYKEILRKRMQALANNPNMGLSIDEVSSGGYRFPDGKHVFYYLKREHDVVFVGFLSNKMAPEKHLERIKSIDSELNL
jgi:plasmid stabilization system protein ParE